MTQRGGQVCGRGKGSAETKSTKNPGLNQRILANHEQDAHAASEPRRRYPALTGKTTLFLMPVAVSQAVRVHEPSEAL